VSVIDWPAARLIVTEGLAPGDVLILDADRHHRRTGGARGAP
jgi:hypothetical protein